MTENPTPLYNFNKDYVDLLSIFNFLFWVTASEYKDYKPSGINLQGNEIWHIEFTRN